MSSLMFSIGAIIIFFLLIVYMVAGSLIEKNKPFCGHEAGIVIIIGIILSWIAANTGHHDLSKMLTFD